MRLTLFYILCLFIVLCADLTTSYAGDQPPSWSSEEVHRGRISYRGLIGGEYLLFYADNTWTGGHHYEEPGVYVLTEMIRKGDTIEDWKELLTIQNFTKSWGERKVKDTFESLKAIREKNCPDKTEWNVISQDRKSILYEWRAKPCAGFPDQHEIARIIYGKNNRFSFRYTVKATDMTHEQRKYALDILKSAEIVRR